MRYNPVTFHATKIMLYLYPCCRLCFIAALLRFAQLIAGSFFHPLLLVRDIQLFTFILILETLKAQIQPYYLLLKPVHRWCKAILQQFVIMPAAFITVADVQYALLSVGQTQGL